MIELKLMTDKINQINKIQKKNEMDRKKKRKYAEKKIVWRIYEKKIQKSTKSSYAVILIGLRSLTRVLWSAHDLFNTLSVHLTFANLNCASNACSNLMLTVQIIHSCINQFDSHILACSLSLKTQTHTHIYYAYSHRQKLNILCTPVDRYTFP